MSAAPDASSPPTEPQPKRRYRIPWGLLIALGAYYGLVTLYVKVQYWESPGYLAAEHVVQAERLLGREDGRDASREALTEAYDHYLEAARLVPGEGWLHKRLETLNWRFDGRSWELPPELRRRAEAVGLTYQRIQTAQKPIMAVGVRDRGWDPDSLRAGPGKAFAWSLVGAFAIVVAWVQIRSNEKRRWSKEHEAELQKMEQELQALGEWRKGLKSVPMEEAAPAAKRPAPRKPPGTGTPRTRSPRSSTGGQPPRPKRPPEEE